jgi:hypothetical protein
MTVKQLWSISLLCALFAHVVQAQPVLSVVPSVSGSNIDWHVLIAPDPDLFSNTGPSGVPPNTTGGSMAVELAFAIDDAELLGVDVNTAAWESESFGSNPFTGTFTEGLWLDLIGDRTFGAFGSIFFTSGDPVEIFNIMTDGIPATLRYGEAASGSFGLGDIIAQASEAYHYTGSLTVPEPSAILLGVVGLVVASLGLTRGRTAV